MLCKVICKSNHVSALESFRESHCDNLLLTVDYSFHAFCLSHGYHSSLGIGPCHLISDLQRLRNIHYSGVDQSRESEVEHLLYRKGDHRTVALCDHEVTVLVQLHALEYAALAVVGLDRETVCILETLAVHCPITFRVNRNLWSIAAYRNLLTIVHEVRSLTVHSHCPVVEVILRVELDSQLRDVNHLIHCSKNDCLLLILAIEIGDHIFSVRVLCH